MTREYNPAGGHPFPRVDKIVIDYQRNGVAMANYRECMAVKIDGKMYFLDEPPVVRELHMDTLAALGNYPVEDPDTGVPIAGLTSNLTLLKMHISAAIRAHQRLIDAEQDALDAAQAEQSTAGDAA